MGGVSVWCEQLIVGMPDYRWDVVAIAVDGEEQPVFDRPDNLDTLHVIPLWGSRPSGRGLPRRELRRRLGNLIPGRRRTGTGRTRANGSVRPEAEFLLPYEAFVASLLADADDVAGGRDRFLIALRSLHDYAAAGGDLVGAVTSNEALTVLVRAWNARHRDRLRPADALEAAWRIGHMLGPLAVEPVRADIVHSSMNGLSVLVGLTAKWRHGTPLVVSEHGIYLRERYMSFLEEDASHAVKVLVLAFFRLLAEATYQVSDALAPHSQYNRRWQLKGGADSSRMWTMYNGVDPEDFPVAEDEPDVPTVVFMGRVDPLKDLHSLIRAFALVRERIPEARLRIFGGTPAGNGPYRDSCADLIDELGLTDAATLEGRVETSVEAYHAGSVVALTSISEGFPYTVVEAMACGRTVVCTDVGGVAEAVGEAGIVVPPRDVAAIADACVELLSDDARRRRLAAAARQRILDNFTLQQWLDAYRELYARLTGETSAPTDHREVVTP
jgi:glycosyltransferase involved in cell wall biosynthesis